MPGGPVPRRCALPGVAEGCTPCTSYYAPAPPKATQRAGERPRPPSPAAQGRGAGPAVAARNVSARRWLPAPPPPSRPPTVGGPLPSRLWPSRARQRRGARLPLLGPLLLLLLGGSSAASWCRAVPTPPGWQGCGRRGAGAGGRTSGASRTG